MDRFNFFPAFSTLKLKAESLKRQTASEQVTHPYPESLGQTGLKGKR